MRVKFLGAGDAFGSGGRLNTCLLVDRGESSFLIDCGASVMIAIRRFGVNPNTISTIILSHLHGDHFGGLHAPDGIDGRVRLSEPVVSRFARGSGVRFGSRHG